MGADEVPAVTIILIPRSSELFAHLLMFFCHSVAVFYIVHYVLEK
jgi:hypothetical protein